MSFIEPFTAIFSGFGEIIGSFFPAQIQSKPGIPDPSKKQDAQKKASKQLWALLKNYKKSHQLLTW